MLVGQGLSAEQAREHLRAQFMQEVANYGSIVLSCAAFRLGGIVSNIYTIVRAGPSELQPVIRDNVEYDDLLLLEKRMTPEEFSELLNRRAISEMMMGSVKVLFQEIEIVRVEKLPGRNPYSQLPGLLYHSRSPGSSPMPGGPLVSYSGRYWPVAAEAIRDWCRLASFHGASDVRRMQIFLSAPSIYFADLRREVDRIEVTVHQPDPPRTKLKIKGAFVRLDLDKTIPVDLDVSGPSVSIPVEAQAIGLDLYLIDESGTAHDWHRESPQGSGGAGRLLTRGGPISADAESLREAISRGEGQEMEFKPFIEPGNEKMGEVLITVQAFANTGGGRILMGVDDHCVVQGVERELAKRAGKTSRSFDEALDDYRGELVQKLSGAMKQPPLIEVRPVKIEGHTVIVVGVLEGTEKPYVPLSGAPIYVRRGANNMMANPDEIRVLLALSAGTE